MTHWSGNKNTKDRQTEGRTRIDDSQSGQLFRKLFREIRELFSSRVFLVHVKTAALVGSRCCTGPLEPHEQTVTENLAFYFATLRKVPNKCLDKKTGSQNSNVEIKLVKKRGWQILTSHCCLLGGSSSSSSSNGIREWCNRIES